MNITFDTAKYKKDIQYGVIIWLLLSVIAYMILPVFGIAMIGLFAGLVFLYYEYHKKQKEKESNHV